MLTNSLKKQFLYFRQKCTIIHFK